MCRRQRSGGTKGSNPVPSSGESCANLTSTVRVGRCPSHKRGGTMEAIASAVPTADAMTMISVPEWDRQLRLVRVHHEHREELGRLEPRKRPAMPGVFAEPSLQNRRAP